MVVTQQRRGRASNPRLLDRMSDALPLSHRANYYNGAQRYEQFLQVGQLYRALILLSLALCLPSASVSSELMVLYRY